MKWFLLFLATATGVLWSPLKHVRWIRLFLPSLVMAAAAGLAAFGVTAALLQEPLTDRLIITALDEGSEAAQGTEVGFRGASVDGVWYHATALVRSPTWIVKDQMVLHWRSYRQPTTMQRDLVIDLPAGRVRFLVFDADQWHGKVQAALNGQTMVVDTFQNSAQHTDLKFDLPGSLPPPERPSWPNTLGAAAFLGVLALCLFLSIRYAEEPVAANVPSSAAHEIWPDLLRCIASFTVVFLHCTCNVYVARYAFDSHDWFALLYVNCFTGFAVPCFFMLSGALLLRREYTVQEALTKRLPKLLIPFLFWSVCYAFLNHFLINPQSKILETVLMLPFQETYWHLWFMYPMLALNLLLPILGFLYHRLDRKVQHYAMLLLFFIPCLANTVLPFVLRPQARAVALHAGMFAQMYYVLGVFFLAAWLTRRRTGARANPRLWLTVTLTGFALTVLCTYHDSLRNGYASKEYFSFVGKLPIFLFAFGVFMMCFSLEPLWQKLFHRASKMGGGGIRALSRISMSIYFVHVFALELISGFTFFGIPFQNNAGSVLHMFLGAAFFYGATAMFCYCGSKIPVLNKLFCTA